jgi:DNA polymerase V
MGTRICAGFPSPADDFLDGELDLTKILVKNRPATFLWRVTGNSMKDVGIFDGVVVVAVINGETSRKLFRRGDSPALTFANRDMPAFPMEDVSQVEIWGVVTWTLHKPRA